MPAALISMMGVPAQSGSLVPSIMTGSVIVGSAVASVIVYGRLSMSKVIVSAPPAAFASRIACLSEPLPESSVAVTKNVASGADCAPTRPTTSTARHAKVARRPRVPSLRSRPPVNSAAPYAKSERTQGSADCIP